MELHQLRYFLAIARTGSFVRAAEEEKVAQPSLSQQIKKLEQELGVPLFDRLGRGVRLTRYGEALQARAETILQQVIETPRQVRAVGEIDGGMLTVGAIPTVLPFALSEPLAAFREKYPRVQLTVVEQTTDRLIESLRGGRLDLAILAFPIKQPEIVCAEMFREPLVVVLPQGHIFSGESKLQPSQLMNEPMLLMREGHCLRDHVLTACSRGNLQFQQIFESDQLSSIFALVASGFGVSIVPKLAAESARGCVLVPLEPRSVRRIGYAQVKGHHAMPPQKAFIQLLRRWNWNDRLRA